MADRVALYLQDTYPLRDAIRYVQYAETAGFEAVWQAENRLSRDALVAIATFAANTRRIRIGSGVVNIWTRNVAALASAFLTLDELAPDRVICGVGPWWEPVAQQVGVVRHKQLKAMRETVMAMRALLRCEPVTYQGEFVRLDAVSLDGGAGRKGARHVPVYVGATGAQMMALAGEIADGVLLNYLVSPAYNTAVLDTLARGAQLAQRTLDTIDRPQLIVCAVDHDRKRALDTARRMVTPYLLHQPQVMRASGVRQELLDEIAQVLRWPAADEQIAAAMRLVPDDVVQLVTAAGTPDEVRAKVRAYVDAGTTCPVLYPLGDDVHLLIDTFADGYSN